MQDPATRKCERNLNSKIAVKTHFAVYQMHLMCVSGAFLGSLHL